MNERINSLIQNLKDSKLWKDSDNLLIDELNFNLTILNKCKDQIENNGLLINITRDQSKDPYYQVNRYITLYQQHFYNVMTIIKVLVSNPRERSKLKAELQKESKDAIELMQEKYN